MEKNSGSLLLPSRPWAEANLGKLGSIGFGIWKMVSKPEAFPAATMKSTVSTRDTFVMAVFLSVHQSRPSSPV